MARERDDRPELQTRQRNYARERLRGILDRDAAQGPNAVSTSWTGMVI